MGKPGARKQKKRTTSHALKPGRGKSTPWGKVQKICNYSKFVTNWIISAWHRIIHKGYFWFSKQKHMTKKNKSIRGMLNTYGLNCMHAK